VKDTARQPAGEPPQQKPARYMTVSWDEFHRDARALAARVADEGQKERNK